MVLLHFCAGGNDLAEEKTDEGESRDSCWTDVLEEVGEDGIHFTGRKTERTWGNSGKLVNTSGSREGGRGEWGYAFARPSEGIRQNYSSLLVSSGAFWGSLGRLLNREFIEGSYGVSHCESFKGLMDSQPPVLPGAMADYTISLRSVQTCNQTWCIISSPIVCWLLPNQTPEAYEAQGF